MKSILRYLLIISYLILDCLPHPISDTFYTPSQKNYSCGEVSIIFTGLPPYHPLVKAQGFNSTTVDNLLRTDASNILKAGYNLRVTLFGPEQPTTILTSQTRGKKWQGTGIGYGIRGGRSEELTIRLEDIVSVFRKTAPTAGMIFDRSPDTALEAIQRNFPISEDCGEQPGVDLGFKVFCEICGE